jgi:hypothetical protein
MADRITGRPYSVKVDETIRGSAFLFDEWKTANVTDKRGYTYVGMKLKFDACINKFFYLQRDTTYEFVSNMEEVELFPLTGDTVTKMVFKKGFTVDSKLTADKFVQVLSEGKITAVKYINKKQEEITEYNVPGKIKVFKDNMTYFFIKEGNAVSQKPGQKLLQEILKDKWATIDAYIKQNDLNAKNEDDCVKVIKYYNTL